MRRHFYPKPTGGNSLDRLIERKQMSTKTTFKRIALVAVASLGFGMLSVAPSSAAAADADLTYNFTATGSTTSPVRGSAVVVPITLTVANGEAATGIISAELTTLPTNSALDAQGGTTASVASTVNALDEAKVTAAVTASTTTAGAIITHTWVSDASEAATAAGAFGFTPDVAGKYVMTLTTGTGTSSDEFTTAGSTTTTLTVEINVAGGALVQAATGLGGVSGTQVSGRSSAAAFWLPAASAATSRYSVTATGATITGAFAQGAQTGVDAENATSYSSATGITQNTANSYATGFTYAGAADTTTAVTITGDKTDSFIVSFTSDVAGPATITVKSMNVTTGVLTTVSSVVVEYGAVAAVSPSLSTVFIGTGNARPTAVETAAIRVPKTAGVALSSTATTGATIAVNVKDATGAALVNQAITATITGSGLITLAEGTGTGSTCLLYTSDAADE